MAEPSVETREAHPARGGGESHRVGSGDSSSAEEDGDSTAVCHVQQKELLSFLPNLGGTSLSPGCQSPPGTFSTGRDLNSLRAFRPESSEETPAAQCNPRCRSARSCLRLEKESQLFCCKSAWTDLDRGTQP